MLRPSTGSSSLGAYRQDSATEEAKAAIDPENKLYWRMNRRRLEGEAIRDSVLAASGTLNLKAGGPPVRTPIETGSLRPHLHRVRARQPLAAAEGPDGNLSPVLVSAQQTHGAAADAREFRSAGRDEFVRGTSVSTHALQSLSLMNSDFMAEQSAAFARRIETEAKGRQARFRRAYALSLGRPPKPAENKLAADFFTKGGTLQEFCLALLNRSEFIYIP